MPLKYITDNSGSASNLIKLEDLTLPVEIQDIISNGENIPFELDITHESAFSMTNIGDTTTQFQYHTGRDQIYMYGEEGWGGITEDANKWIRHTETFKNL